MPNIPAPPGNGTVVNIVLQLPEVDNTGQFIASTGVWENYWIHSSYDTDQHVFQLGVTTPTGFGIGQTVAFVQLAAPTLVWTCSWTATMQGGLPSVPNPTELVDSNWVLLYTSIEPSMVEALPDGFTYVYTLSGTYWYGHANPQKAQMFFPKAAWLADTNPMGRAVDADMFVPGLIDTPGNTGTSDDLEEIAIVEANTLNEFLGRAP